MLRLVIFFVCTISVFGQSEVENISSLLAQKEYRTAKEQAEKLFAAQPTNLKAQELLGDTYGYLKDWDKAITIYKNLTELKPYNANYHYKYGGALGMKAKSVNKLQALMMINDVEQAFLKATQLNPKHINAHWALVHYYLYVPGIVGGSNKKALNYAKKLQALSAVDGFLALGQVSEYKEDFKIAETNYKKAVSVGGSKTCYMHLIDLYVTFEKYQMAVNTLQEAYNKLGDDSFLERISEIKTKID
ncbi:tetratricopeptide repeat protein [Mangrovimonas cancribranchiae]|uniref:Tetratricopeptide repeat protein n=1 Tax=Mangrovimonas cancribranchiae TaxID=3080055 RepID=A0AAU6P893_9FLAO